jgi:hypothetical protein
MLFGMSVSAQYEDFSRADKSEYLDADFFFYQARFAEANSILLGLHKTLKTLKYLLDWLFVRSKLLEIRSLPVIC